VVKVQRAVERECLPQSFDWQIIYAFSGLCLISRKARSPALVLVLFDV
jgi:hypothetical protein